VAIALGARHSFAMQDREISTATVSQHRFNDDALPPRKAW